jgi:hypothetical protein
MRRGSAAVKRGHQSAPLGLVNFGSLAMFAAIRRASSRVSNLASVLQTVSSDTGSNTASARGHCYSHSSGLWLVGRSAVTVKRLITNSVSARSIAKERLITNVIGAGAVESPKPAWPVTVIFYQGASEPRSKIDGRVVARVFVAWTEISVSCGHGYALARR